MAIKKVLVTEENYKDCINMIRDTFSGVKYFFKTAVFNGKKHEQRFYPVVEEHWLKREEMTNENKALIAIFNKYSLGCTIPICAGNILVFTNRGLVVIKNDALTLACYDKARFEFLFYDFEDNHNIRDAYIHTIYAELITYGDYARNERKGMIFSELEAITFPQLFFNYRVLKFPETISKKLKINLEGVELEIDVTLYPRAFQEHGITYTPLAKFALIDEESTVIERFSILQFFKALYNRYFYKPEDEENYD